MYQSLSVVELKKKCKQFKLKGYSKLKKKDLQKLLQTYKQENGSTKQVETIQKLALINIKPLKKKNVEQISQYFKKPPSLEMFCKEKNKYEMNKLMLKTKFQILLSYYQFRNPDKREDSSSSPILYKNLQYNVPEFLTYGSTQQFIPLDPNHFATINDFMDQEWFVEQNQYTKSLSAFQRAFLFAYSNNSFDTITPFLLESTKSKPKYKETLQKYLSWMSSRTNKDWVHPLQLSLIVVSHSTNLRKHFPNTQKATSLFDTIQKDKSFSCSDTKKVIRDYVKEKHFEFLMKLYLQVLSNIFKEAPPIKKPFYLFRSESQIRYNSLLKEKKTSMRNVTFTSTSIDQVYILKRRCKEFVRFRMQPGSKAIFIRGCSYFKKENEFLIPPSVFDNVRESKFRKEEDICSDRKTVIYDVDVRAL